MATGQATSAAARLAWHDAWRAFWISRVVVVAAALLAVLVVGVDEANEAAFDRGDRTDGLLAAPFARWDSVWLLEIAETGYTGDRYAFFPLYPLLVQALGALTGSLLVAGVALSAGCLLGALVVLHRLVALDFGRDVARLCVLLVAVVPGALWFSSLYSEALFLLLSVGAVYLARTDRWALAGVAGGLAAATRSAGLVLVVPLVLLWWQGSGRRVADLAWVALVPAGLAAFCLGAELDGAGWRAPFDAQEGWGREFAGPLGAIPAAVSEAWADAGKLWRGDAPVPAPYDERVIDPLLLGTLLLVAVAFVGAVRRLPAAYWAYAGAALLLPLSYPVAAQPLMSLPRFAAVLWPLHLWAALVLVRRGTRVRAVVVGACLVGLALVSAEVATWGWVA